MEFGTEVYEGPQRQVATNEYQRTPMRMYEVQHGNLRTPTKVDGNQNAINVFDPFLLTGECEIYDYNFRLCNVCFQFARRSFGVVFSC